jgi:hypothetical protein
MISAFQVPHEHPVRVFATFTEDLERLATQFIVKRSYLIRVWSGSGGRFRVLEARKG